MTKAKENNILAIAQLKYILNSNECGSIYTEQEKKEMLETLERNINTKDTLNIKLLRSHIEKVYNDLLKDK